MSVDETEPRHTCDAPAMELREQTADSQETGRPTLPTTEEVVMTLMAGDATTAPSAPALNSQPSLVDNASVPSIPAPRVSADEFDMARLDQVLSVEAPTAVWWADAAKLLDHLSDRMFEHRTTVEGPHGLHQELIDTQPRLAPAVDRLERDHAELADRMVAARLLVGERAGDPDGVGTVLASLTEIRDQLNAHQRRANTVLHDAHCVDIGGE